ncbi:RDD family protein [Streptomyces sp. AJS327]|uniref:RDD family protein n=1 Tax=Streptomyces sp. AJS327 TaxID=2545265 RepID=UPI0015DD601E|nr:RDD family protein [Streptomyces sp. AJS327]MBA0049576.1 RDD family protein [Streptomyces sp. AJS327]
MTTEQPENDPYRKPPPGGTEGGAGAWPGGSSDPYGVPPPGRGDPYGAPPPGGPYEGGAYGSPYGSPGPGGDPLAGMPPLANRGKRLVARIIDGLIIGIPLGLLTALVPLGFNRGDNGGGYWPQVVYIVVYLVYEGLMLTQSGQTVGKKAMHIRVAMLEHGGVPQGGPGWFRAALYSVPLLVPCLGFLFWLVNVLYCTWDRPYQQCVHDKAARTVVVEAR